MGPEVAPSTEPFTAFYEREYRPVLVLARVLAGDAETAEDVTHDSFAAALVDWERLDNPSAWVRRVVANKARSHWRRRYAEHRALRTVAASTPGRYELPDDTEAFWAEVRRLPARQAQAVTLYYLEDLSVSEIAAVLDCAEATVRVHLMRGRRALAGRLEVDDE
jgi:RNA polymerase sigma factor (sigma-70 family)